MWISVNMEPEPRAAGDKMEKRKVGMEVIVFQEKWF
jgi:hypothetical protein